MCESGDMTFNAKAEESEGVFHLTGGTTCTCMPTGNFECGSLVCTEISGQFVSACMRSILIAQFGNFASYKGTLM